MVIDFRSGAQQLSGLVPILAGWTPDHFWKATPMELRAIFEAFSAIDRMDSDAIPLGNADIEKLKEKYPDG